LDRQAKHGTCALRIVEPDLELQARCFLTADAEDVGFQVSALPAGVILRELLADEATDDGWSVGKNVGHDIEPRWSWLPSNQTKHIKHARDKADQKNQADKHGVAANADRDVFVGGFK
jgi:hypothetical protein